MISCSGGGACQRVRPSAKRGQSVAIAGECPPDDPVQCGRQRSLSLPPPSLAPSLSPNLVCCPHTHPCLPSSCLCLFLLLHYDTQGLCCVFLTRCHCCRQSRIPPVSARRGERTTNTTATMRTMTVRITPTWPRTAAPPPPRGPPPRDWEGGGDGRDGANNELAHVRIYVYVTPGLATKSRF
jgi:hypothetical protein